MQSVPWHRSVVAAECHHRLIQVLSIQAQLMGCGKFQLVFFRRQRYGARANPASYVYATTDTLLQRINRDAKGVCSSTEGHATAAYRFYGLCCTFWAQPFPSACLAADRPES
ncbi:unnamed protein product [Sphacelaria rigidula]